jgi:3-oxoacyl-[acyl-carrier protein] reductase
MMGLKGKRALVTGGSRGIGAAVVQLFAEHGVHVAVGYRRRKEDADRLTASLREKYGVTTFAHAADISTMQGAEDLVSLSADALGGLDFFVGNAGVWQCDDVPLTEMTDEQWRRTMAENVD